MTTSRDNGFDSFKTLPFLHHTHNSAILHNSYKAQLKPVFVHVDATVRVNREVERRMERSNYFIPLLCLLLLKPLYPLKGF